MKQTAVEWLLDNLHCLHSTKWDDIVEQTLEMEKQQIIDACNLQGSDYRGMPTYNKSGEQYYNETFRNE